MELTFPRTEWRHIYPEVSESDWRDGGWQQRHALTDLDSLAAKIPLTPEERLGCAATRRIFRLGITPYYAALIDREHPWCPVRRQAIPLPSEAVTHAGELNDPLGEDHNRPVPAIVHKYPDRVLFLALDRCSVYCRHCTRRRLTGQEHTDLDRQTMAEGLEYIRSHPEVRDVLISGGDPFLLSTPRLGTLLSSLRAVPHVEMIRVGTRVPVCNPFRVDDALARTLRESEAFVVTHFNHPKEVTAEAREACERLVDHGVPVENQTVLLRRVNSNARIIRDLNHRCLRMRVRPYYLHQGDVAQGLDHLRTPISLGIEIIEALRGHTSGLAVPHLAVDLPDGGGKVTIQPDYLVARNAGETVFRNYLGERYVYPEPQARDCSVPYDEVFYGAPPEAARKEVHPSEEPSRQACAT
jgi:lysine 2,3-aminomutase